MSCWATVAVAAECLGTTVQDVLARVIAGELYTREENGVLFVAVPARMRSAAPAVPAEDESAPLNFRAARASVRRLRPAA